jgi:hypothetical protein
MLALLVLSALQEAKAFKEMSVQLEHKEFKDQLDHRVYKEIKAFKAI